MLLNQISRHNSRLYPNRPAIISGDRIFTHSQVLDRGNRLANALMALDIKPGDRVCLLRHNCHHYIELYLSIPKIGAIFVPFNWVWTKKETAEALNYVKPKLLIFGEEYREVVNNIKQDVEETQSFICIGEPEENEYGYEELIARSSNTEPLSRMNEDDPVVIIFTGGTTGKIRGVILSHRNILSNSINGIVGRGIRNTDSYLHIFPMCFASGMEILFQMAYMGATHVVPEHRGGFDPELVIAEIERHEISVVKFIPPNLMTKFIQSPGFKSEKTRSLRLAIIGTADLSIEDLRNARERLRVDFAKAYGQTQATAILTVFHPDEQIFEGPEKKRLLSCGREALNVEVRIVDENGDEVPAGEVGEIIGRGDNIMKGYWNLPEETAEALKDRWLHTGDMGRLDEEGYLYFVERKTDMIKTGGINVYPQEVEAVISRHPAVAEVGVIGIPHPRWIEAIKAVVVLKPGMESSEEDIIKHCNLHLARYKVPKSIDFEENLPKTLGGKIQRKILRTRYLQDQEEM